MSGQGEPDALERSLEHHCEDLKADLLSEKVTRRKVIHVKASVRSFIPQRLMH
jgi:hypothetical protein